MNKKTAKIFECKNCDFRCSKLSNYKQHLTTGKHVFNKNLNDFELKSCQTHNFKCDICGKDYKGRNGLWYHKQKCQETISKTDIKSDSSVSTVSDKELIIMLINQNKELIEIVKNGTNGTNNTINYNNNSNNKTFNLQVFLNETCKDAMNISDFVESIKLQVSDLENIGKVGYIEGISNIIIKNLKALDVEKRQFIVLIKKGKSCMSKTKIFGKKKMRTIKNYEKQFELLLIKIYVCLKTFERNIQIAKNMTLIKIVNTIRLFMKPWVGKAIMIMKKILKSLRKLQNK